MTLGRPRLETLEDDESARKKAAAIIAMRVKGVGIRKIAIELGVGVGTVMRLTK